MKAFAHQILVNNKLGHSDALTGAQVLRGQTRLVLVGTDSQDNFTFLKDKGNADVVKPSAYIQWRGRAEDGYIVAGADPGATVALMEIEGTLCGGGKTLVFKSPAEPRVIYLGDISALNLASVEGNYQYRTVEKIELQDGFERAKEYIDANFPNLKAKLEKSPYELKATEPCVIETTIPVILF